MPAAKVTTNLVDLSARVSSTGTYNAAIVVAALKGPIDTPTKVTSQTDFLRKFTPDEKLTIGMENSLYEAYQYLTSQSNLYVVRAAHTTDLETTTADYPALYGGAIIRLATSTTDNASWTKGEEDPEAYEDDPSTDALTLYGSNQGEWNNNISVAIETDPDVVKVDNAFIIYVYKKNVLVETWTCSLNPSCKNGYGVNCYVETVLEGSNYLRGTSLAVTATTVYAVTVKATAGDQTFTYTGYTGTKGSSGTTVTDKTKVFKDTGLSTALELMESYTDPDTGETTTLNYTYTYSGITVDTYPMVKGSSKDTKGNWITTSLAGGSDGSVVLTSDRIRALKTLNNTNDISIQLIMDGGQPVPAYQKAIYDVCENREESCHGIICTDYGDETNSDALTALKKYRNYTLNMNNYSMEMYTPHQLYYDEFNDRNIYISPGPYVAAAIMKYADELGWHWAVAGYNRGVINSLDVAATFEPSIVDELSDAQINTIIKDPGYGNVIWDELTQQAKASDMQDAHISRYLNIYLRPKLKEALKPFLFEFNDDTTRQLIVQMIDTFMKPQQANRAVYEYKITCDSSNNSDSDIENNILNCWLYVKPTKIAKFIKMSVICTPYGVDLSSFEM